MKSHKRELLTILLLLLTIQNSCTTVTKHTADQFLDDLKRRTFNYFWEVVDTVTWQTDDRHPTKNFTSIASTGFALTSYIIGVENSYVSRDDAAVRVLNTLEWLWKSKQSTAPNATGYNGFYYHFLSYKTGERYKNVELSTIDTGLLLAGILSCQSYFDGNNPNEKSIRQLADSIYLRVDWPWAMNNSASMYMGWSPENGFIQSTWQGYNEAMILLVLALGSPTHPIGSTAWSEWCSTYRWSTFYGYQHINFDPLFGHQYSQMYIDFRGIYDDYTKGNGIDYFENSRRATLSNRAYCISNPNGYTGYSTKIWGLTACDGPGYTKRTIAGKEIQFFDYRARGACSFSIVDDGTIAPTAAGGSFPFAPDECIDALYSMYKMYGSKIYGKYGFKDAFNLTYGNGWFDTDYIGIDQGPILIQLENYQTELIWNLMKRNKYIVNGLQKAGFKGGWLSKIK
ncbi:MAG: glucoamylase family protein [Bacteroidales bacterium]